GASCRKNAAAIGRPATTIGSRLSMTPEKRAAAGITLSAVMSRPPPVRPTPKSSSSVARTKASRSKPGRENAVTAMPYPGEPSEVEGSCAACIDFTLSAPETGALVDEPRYHVAVRPAHFHFRA